jgi:hypothetical protein
MNWKLWGQGLLAAAINGAAGAGLGILGTWATNTMTGTQIPLAGKVVGVMSAAGAIQGTVNYLLQSPRKVEVPATTPAK